MPQPTLLLSRLQDIATSLSRYPDALGLLGLGSVGLELERLDEHSDLDFFVIVAEGTKQDFLTDLSWLEGAAPVAFSFANTPDGRKALFADGVFAEYAVFEPQELRQTPYAPGRFVWKRDQVPSSLAAPPAPAPAQGAELDWHVNEALTNLLVGLHREGRGERVSALRFIQVYAVDRVLHIAQALEPGAGHRDAFSIERRAEARLPRLAQALPGMMQGYGHNRASALCLLDWLEAHVEVHPSLAREIRTLGAGS